MDDLPYKVEYARTGRAGCKACKMNIGQDSLRIARMVQVSSGQMGKKKRKITNPAFPILHSVL